MVSAHTTDLPRFFRSAVAAGSCRGVFPSDAAMRRRLLRARLRFWQNLAALAKGAGGGMLFVPGWFFRPRRAAAFLRRLRWPRQNVHLSTSPVMNSTERGGFASARALKHT